MKTEIIEDKICINIWDVMDNLTSESKQVLIDRLSCEDDIIHMVADQLVYGLTNDGSCGGSNCDASETNTPLDKYRRLIAKEAGNVAKSEIDRLEDKVDRLKKDNAKLSKYTWRIYHNYNLRRCPADIIKGVDIGWAKNRV